MRRITPPLILLVVASGESNRSTHKQLSSRLKVEMTQLPQQEWDFRWIADAHEAEHVGIYEAAREVLRVSAARAGCSVPDAMSRFSGALSEEPHLLERRKALDWVVGVFLYLASAQFVGGIFPRAAISFLDPTLDLVDAMRKLRAVKIQPGAVVRVFPPSLLIQIEPGVGLREAQDALEFQFKMSKWDMKGAPSGRPATPIIRALSVYRYSMGRPATNLYLDFKEDLSKACAVRPGRPRTEFGAELYQAITGSHINDSVNLWSTDLAKFEGYVADAVREMVELLKARR